MSRNSSRTPCASISRKTAGNGPPRSGRQMKVAIAPSLVAMSRVCSIMCAAPTRCSAHDKQNRRPGESRDPLFRCAHRWREGMIIETASGRSETCTTVGPGLRRNDRDRRGGSAMAVQAIGQRVRREEDFRLLTGRGRYVDDVPAIGALRGYVLRSPHAHARVTSIDADEAKTAPGIFAVLTGADLKRRGLGTLRPLVPRRKKNGGPGFVCPQPLLAQDHVRYVGDPVAFIVAETLNRAKDAAELIQVAYEPLPAIITAEAALAPGAPAVWPDNPGNEAFTFEAGDRAAVEASLARAPRFARMRIPVNRVTANSMAPRRCLAYYDPAEERYTIRCTVQSVHQIRAALAGQIFRLPHHQVRVTCDNMGGGFGMKGGCYPEYGLSLWASEVTGRPVRWTAERSEGPLSDEQARGSTVEAELGLDDNGKFLALRTRWISSIGAYYSSDRPTIPLTIGMGCLVNTYTFEAVYAECIAVLTNTMTTAPYRGGSRPEPIYVVESIIEKAARELGIDPAELRRRNTIPASAMPYTTPLRQTYDSGDFAKNLDDALHLAAYDRIEERRAEARRRGKLRGIGVATTVAATGGRDYEHAEIRFDPAGGVVLITGSMDHGQGHGTTFKQVLSEKLGIDADKIRYRFGDSDLVTMGIGTFGSRSAQLAGSAIVTAADRLIDKGRKIAAHVMEATASDIVFEAGRFTIAGTDRSVAIEEIARQAFQSAQLPEDVEAGFTERSNYGPADAAP